jgi:hypothetical protein
MRGEYPNPQQDQSFEQDKAKDNVLEFKPKEKPAEHALEHIMGEVGTHKRSMYELGELGYSSLEDARFALAELREEKKATLDNINKHVMFSAIGKMKDKLFNQGIEVKKLTELESKIHSLESAVRFTQATEQMAESESSGEQTQAFKRAA